MQIYVLKIAFHAYVYNWWNMILHHPNGYIILHSSSVQIFSQKILFLHTPHHICYFPFFT